MTLAKFKTMLDELNLPVGYYEFPEGTVPSLPFIVYFETGTDNFSADGIVYQDIHKIATELYSVNRDLTIEHSIESLFEKYGIFWDKEFQYLNDEKCYITIYETEIS